MIKKITVLHMVERLDVGGMENGVINIANHIDDTRFRCIICCFSGQGTLAGRLTGPDGRLIALGYGPGFHPAAAIRLAGLFRKLRVDILHTHGWGARSLLAFVGAKLARIPICINGEHGVLYMDNIGQRFAQKVMGRMVDGTLSVSENLKYKLVNRLGLRPNCITVIPNGVNTRKFSGDYDTGDLRKKIGVNERDFLVGIIGTLKSQKNQSVAITAMRELKRRGRKACLLLIGDGPDRSHLEVLAHEQGVSDHIRFLGYREDIPQLLTLVDALILSSIQDHEGMSNVILEAMASRVTVISSGSVGSDELIRDGETGLLFDYSDVMGLADSIYRLMTAPGLCSAISESAYQKILRDHTLEVMVKRYQNYYTKMIQGDVS